MIAHAEPIDATMTVEEYLALEEAAEIKHEFVDGHVYAMSGGTLNHDLIANNIRALIGSHVADGSCTLFGPDVRLRISPSIYYYPDALVICDETIRGDAIEVTTPRLVVEVLSDSTEATDRGAKFANYQSLATCQEYVLIDSRRRAVERFRRTADRLWLYQRYTPEEIIILETIGLTCPIATFYRRTTL